MLKNIRTYYLSLLFAILNLIVLKGEAQNIAHEGKFDLSKFSFSKTGNVELNGVWEFYPNKLYNPADFSKGIQEIPKFISIPSLWDKIIFSNSEKPYIGYGTYHLSVTVPDSIKIYALRLKRIESSYKIWINDKELIEVGKVGMTPKTTVPQQKTLTKIFNTETSKLSIIIQVSNFKHRKGGIVNPITLGPAENILKQSNKARAYELFIIGVLIIMAVFHFGLFVVRRKDYSLLYFGLLLISEIFSMIINGETLLTYYFPDTSWLMLKRIDYISNFARISFFLLFFWQIYKTYINKYFVWAIAGINIILTIIVLLTELQTFAFTLFIFIFLSAISLIYVLYAQFKSLFIKEEGALIPLIGTLVLLLTAVNDILFVAGIYNSLYLVPLGLFVFIFSQSYLLSFNFSKLYKHEEELNKLISDIEELKNELLNKKSFDIYNSFKILCNYFHADRGFLFSMDDNKELVFKANYPKTNYNQYNEQFPKDLLLKTISEKESVIISGISGNSYYDKDYLLKYSVKYSLTVPFKVSDTIRAAVYLERNNKKNPFTKHDVKIAEEIAAQIIGLIDNSDLYLETENIRKNLEKIIKARTKDVSNQKDLLENQKAEIEAINNQLSDTFEETQTKNNIITENIKSARIIQETLLPETFFLRKKFEDIFVIFRPKEIVSGDFYKMNEITNEKGEKNIIFTLADCTGHGVPGVLISLIGNDLINNAIINKKIYKPAYILNQIQQDIAVKLGQSEKDKKVKDGMDMIIINFNPESYILEYSGAKIDLLIFRNNKLNEIKANRLSISAELHERLKDKNFKNYKIKLKKGDILYLATDGYQDQFGGKNDTKFMKKKFRALLEEIGDLQFNIQRSRLLKTLNHWQGKNIQNDDITVIGIKV